MPEINDIQYTLKHQQLNTEQLKEHIYNLEYKANSIQEILESQDFRNISEQDCKVKIEQFKNQIR